MFVQRLAKGLAIGLSLLISTVVADFSAVRWLSLIAIPLIVVWLYAARYAGLAFEKTAGPTSLHAPQAPCVTSTEAA